MPRTDVVADDGVRCDVEDLDALESQGVLAEKPPFDSDAIFLLSCGQVGPGDLTRVDQGAGDEHHQDKGHNADDSERRGPQGSPGLAQKDVRGPFARDGLLAFVAQSGHVDVVK